MNTEIEEIATKLLMYAILTFVVCVGITSLFIWAAYPYSNSIKTDIENKTVRMGSVREYAAFSTLAGISAILSLTLPIILFKGKELLDEGQKIANSVMPGMAMMSK